jgi:hypothetical protein
VIRMSETRPSRHSRAIHEGSAPFCWECSQAASDWVPWPCPNQKIEQFHQVLTDWYYAACVEEETGVAAQSGPSPTLPGTPQ